MVNFSVVLIAKNESKTLPRLIKSLTKFQELGGEIVLCDTGSTDGTPEIARALGCRVHEEGERFIKTVDAELAEQMNRHFVVEGEEPIVKEGDRFFDFAAARNYAATLSNTDMIAMPDCDEEYTALNLEKIIKLIDDGAVRFEYNFVFAHDQFGKETVKFIHSKFYNRNVFRWVGVVHEVLNGAGTSLFLGETDIKLEHWQNHSSNRSVYLPGLAYDCYMHPTKDRNSHYLARELMWAKRPKSAIKEFERHISMNAWLAERAQSKIFIGDCHLALGDDQSALQAYWEAFTLDPSRREALIRLAEYYWKKEDQQHVACYAMAALAITWKGFYCDQVPHYKQVPHEMLYWALWWMKQQTEAEYHWRKALEYQPLNSKYLHDSRFFIKLPKVSIVVPTLGREEKLQRLLKLIPETANYPDFEIIVVRDTFDNRQGVPKSLKMGVEKSTGDYVMYLGNDCIPKQDFLILAVMRMLKEFPDGVGLIGLNDGYWKRGEMATHWLASKELLPMLDGEFFHTGYYHCGCDNELTERCRVVGKYVWCKEAMVYHDHPVQTGFRPEDMDEVYSIAYNRERTIADTKLLFERSQLLGFEPPRSFTRPEEDE